AIGRSQQRFGECRAFCGVLAFAENAVGACLFEYAQLAPRFVRGSGRRRAQQWWQDESERRNQHDRGAEQECSRHQSSSLGSELFSARAETPPSAEMRAE